MSILKAIFTFFIVWMLVTSGIGYLSSLSRGQQINFVKALLYGLYTVTIASIALAMIVILF